MQPRVHSSFDSVQVILRHLNTFPERWVQYDNILECFESEKNFCKILTGNGILNYMIANQDKFINTTLVEKFKLWKAIRSL